MTSKAVFQDFFIIRHGETDWNREGRLQGRRDVDLNPLGRRQSVAAGERLARLLAGRGLDPQALDFVASPLSRTCDTMVLLRGALGLDGEPFRRDDQILELSFGRWEGRTWPEIKRSDPAAAEERRRDRWCFVPPGGESYAMLEGRVASWLGGLAGDTGVVAHGGVARVLLHLVAGVAKARAPVAEISQGRVLVFRSGAAHWA